MSALSDKVSYLRGLAEGMNLDNSSGEGKLIAEIIEALKLVSDKVEALDESYEELSDYVECIDDDLEALEVRADELDEEDFDEDDFDEDDFDEDDFEDELDDEDEDCHCGCCDCGEEEEEDEEAFGMYAGCLCSECGGMFSVDVNCNEDQLFICPHCGKRVKAVQMNCQNVPVAKTIEGEDKEDE